MDSDKIGNLIQRRRKEMNLTQKNLADRLFLSDKTISKWERGIGLPDVTILPLLANQLGITLDSLMQGEFEINDNIGGNMKNLKFYYCKSCSNIVTSTLDVEISCCGKKLSELIPDKASEEEKLEIQLIEHDYYITSDHPMTKDNYISFVALLTGDSIMLKKQYPEWNLQLRIPNFGKGKLVWYSTSKGLKYQLTNIKK